MQPIKFKPILKTTIWGGCKIPRIRHISGLEDKRIGESWEISGLEGSESVVDGGFYDGMSLSRLVGTLKGKLVGEENYRRFGNRFPLLIKFIDARQDLSIQVHPDDETALRHGIVNGKNEMWYLLDSEPYASLRCGMKEELSADDITKKVADGTICDSITQYNVKAGDCFYIPAGRVHSIGAGCLIAEIQQTSDTTYRTITAGTATATCGSFTSGKRQNVSITLSVRITGRHTNVRKMYVYRWLSASISKPHFTTSTIFCNSTILTLTVSLY